MKAKTALIAAGPDTKESKVIVKAYESVFCCFKYREEAME